MKQYYMRSRVTRSVQVYKHVKSFFFYVTTKTSIKSFAYTLH